MLSIWSAAISLHEDALSGCGPTSIERNCRVLHLSPPKVLPLSVAKRILSAPRVVQARLSPVLVRSAHHTYEKDRQRVDRARWSRMSEEERQDRIHERIMITMGIGVFPMSWCLRMENGVLRRS